MAKATAAVLQAKTSFGGTLDGAQFAVHEGDLIDADHPAVRKWPDYFGPLTVHHRSAEVEQATAAPGEKRA